MKKLSILITESQLEPIVELFVKKPSDPISLYIRDFLKDVYKPLGKWGRIQNPENNCETGEGVIGVYPHIEGEDEWSILNRFDTNSKVRQRMREIFTRENPTVNDNNDNLFVEWMKNNKENLFNGKYTEELVELNRETINKGNENEKFVIKILQDYFGGSTEIKRFCSGDIRDTKKGMDISVKIGNNILYVQVKPFIKIKSYIDASEGDTFFQLNAYFDPSKYSEKNVDIFFFVNGTEYVAFQNDRKKIKQSTPNITNFYEPYLLSNIVFDKQPKPKIYRKATAGKQEDVKKLFKTSQRKLENLIFKKQALEDLIKAEMEKIKSMKGEI